MAAVEDGKITFSGDVVFVGSGNDRILPWTAVFDRDRGAFVQYVIGGDEVIDSPLVPNFGRAAIENDLGAGQDKRCDIWRNAVMKPAQVDFADRGGFHEIDVTYEPVGAAAVRVRYEVYADGEIVITESLEETEGLAEMPMLPRFGLEFRMGAQAEWGRLLKEIGRVGSWGTPNLHPTTSCVVRFLGGWTQVCLWQEKDLQWHQRRFIDAWIQTHGREEVLELGAEAVKQLAAPKPTGGMKSLSSMIASRRLEARENA